MKLVNFLIRMMMLTGLLVSCSSSEQYFGHQSAETSERVTISDENSQPAVENSGDLNAEFRNQESDFLTESPELDQEAVPPQMITGSFLVRVECEQDTSEDGLSLVCEAVQEHKDDSETTLDLNQYQLNWLVTDKFGKKLDPESYVLDLIADQAGKVKIKLLTDTEVRIGLESNQIDPNSIPVDLRVEPYEMRQPDSENQAGTNPSTAVVTTPESAGENTSQVPVTPVADEPKVEPFTTDGKSLVFEENFTGFSFLNQKWDAWGQLTFLSFQNNQFNCQVPQSISVFAGIASRQQFDFSNGFIQLSIPSVFAPQEGMEQAIFGLNFGNGYDAFFFAEAGKLFARKKISGVATNMGSVPFDSSVHKYLGIGHDDGTSLITFYISSNGSDWQVYSSFFYDGNLASTKFEIQCGAWKPVPVSYSSVDDLKFYK